MKKLFSLVLVALFLIGYVSLGWAAADYASDNVVILGPFGGRTGVSPVTEVIRVRYAKGGSGGTGAEANWPTLASGDVVIWDTMCNDGVTVSACVTAYDPLYAGVLVTTLQTADSLSKNGNERNWGYMAKRGYVLAKVDTSLAGTGEILVCEAAASTTNSAGMGSFMTSVTGGANILLLSHDIGVLLNDTATDGLMPVFLK